MNDEPIAALGTDAAINLRTLKHLFHQALAGQTRLVQIPQQTQLEPLIMQLSAVAPLHELAVIAPSGSFHAFSALVGLAKTISAQGTVVSLTTGNTVRLCNQYLNESATHGASLHALTARLALYECYQPLKLHLLTARYAQVSINLVATSALFSTRVAASSDLNLLAVNPIGDDSLTPWHQIVQTDRHPVYITAAGASTTPVAEPVALTVSERQALWQAQGPDRVRQAVKIGRIRYTVFEYQALALVIYDAAQEPFTVHTFRHRDAAMIEKRAQKLGHLDALYRTPVSNDHTLTTSTALHKFAHRLFQAARHGQP